MFAYNTRFVHHKVNMDVLQSTADLLKVIFSSFPLCSTTHWASQTSRWYGWRKRRESHSWRGVCRIVVSVQAINELHWLLEHIVLRPSAKQCGRNGFNVALLHPNDWKANGHLTSSVSLPSLNLELWLQSYIMSFDLSLYNSVKLPRTINCPFPSQLLTAKLHVLKKWKK